MMNNDEFFKDDRSDLYAFGITLYEIFFGIFKSTENKKFVETIDFMKDFSP